MRWGGLSFFCRWWFVGFGTDRSIIFVYDSSAECAKTGSRVIFCFNFYTYPSTTIKANQINQWVVVRNLLFWTWIFQSKTQIISCKHGSSRYLHGSFGVGQGSLTLIDATIWRLNIGTGERGGGAPKARNNWKVFVQCTSSIGFHQIFEQCPFHLGLSFIGQIIFSKYLNLTLTIWKS